MTQDMAYPEAVELRLVEIDQRLATLVDELEPAARAWFIKRRERELEEAKAYVAAAGNHSERKQAAVESAGAIGVIEEAAFEGKRHVLKALETRSVIGTALLKSQGRVS